MLQQGSHLIGNSGAQVVIVRKAMRRLGLPLPPVEETRAGLAVLAPSQIMGEIASAFIMLIVVATEQACVALADSAGVTWRVPPPARSSRRARDALFTLLSPALL